MEVAPPAAPMRRDRCELHRLCAHQPLHLQTCEHRSLAKRSVLDYFHLPWGTKYAGVARNVDIYLGAAVNRSLRK